MSGNGVGIGMACILILAKRIPEVLMRAPTGYCAEYPGTTGQPSSVAPIASTTTPAAGATTLVSASPDLPINPYCFHFSWLDSRGL